jgi:hypothetical protein
MTDPIPKHIYHVTTIERRLVHRTYRTEADSAWEAVERWHKHSDMPGIKLVGEQDHGEDSSQEGDGILALRVEIADTDEEPEMTPSEEIDVSGAWEVCDRVVAMGWREGELVYVNQGAGRGNVMWEDWDVVARAVLEHLVKVST